MTPSRSVTRLIQHRLTVALVTLLTCAGAAVAQEDRIDQLIGDLQAGPIVHMTPKAQEYAAARNRYYPGFDQAVQTDQTQAAEKCLRATISLGDMGQTAWRAVDVLVTRFPRSIHTITMNETYYDQRGGLEDWIATKVMSEKNKFMLNPPFLGYDALTKCDGFVVVTEEHATAGERYGAGKRLMEAYVTVSLTFTFYSGACALSRITGNAFGTDQAQWQQWWTVNKGYAPTGAGTPSVSTGSGTIGKGLADVQVGGVYRFYLTTGDQFVGTVESKDDTSLIVETKEGKALAFGSTLVEQHELVSLPAKQNASGSSPAPAGVTEGAVISYDDLQKRQTQLSGTLVEITIKSGAVFRGAVTSVDAEMVKLSVEGSTIPIARTVVTQITTIAGQKLNTTAGKPAATSAAPAVALPQGPFDTVTVTNPQTDDYGRPKAPIVFIGRIALERADSTFITLTDGSKAGVRTDKITSISRHTTASYEDRIKLYAKALFCPDNMILVDVPPGKDGRPFLKTCIDKYEYPNIKGSYPRGNVSFEEAKGLCAAQGKRVCTAEEWQWACSGLEGYAYPYGWNFEKENCNAAGIDQLEPAGNRNKCAGKFGAYDMVGNIFEWVSQADGNPGMMGGPLSKCQTLSPGVGGGAKPQTGFRCCKSN